MVILRSFCRIGWLICLLGLSGCQSNEADSFTIAVLPKGNTQAFWQHIHRGAQQAADELGVELLWQGPEVESDRQAQIRLMQRFIREQVDAIVLAPQDSRSLGASVKAARKRGIPVVIIDSELEGSQFASFIATDNYEAGRLCGTYLTGKIPAKGRVLMLKNLEGSASTSKREKGFQDWVQAQAPEVDLLVSDQYAEASLEKGAEISRRMIQRYSDLDGIFCPNETTTEAMLQVLRENQVDTSLVFVGFDANPTLIQGLRQGEIDALALQNPRQMGYLGVATAVQVLKGETVEKMVDTGVRLVSPGELEDPKVRSLLEE